MKKFKSRENNGLSMWKEKEMEVCKTATWKTERKMGK
jgi:hypothetical protein